jgi:hypothetical protein
MLKMVNGGSKNTVNTFVELELGFVFMLRICVYCFIAIISDNLKKYYKLKFV